MQENEVLETQNENQNLENGNENQDVPPKTYTQEEFEQAIKEAEAKGYGKGKYDTNSKWEKTAKERERLAKEEAEKAAKFEKMSDLQKAETRASEAEAKLQELEDEIALTKQREETCKMLIEQGLSTKEYVLRGVLVPKDAEATKRAIEDYKADYLADVQSGVEGRIKIHTPKQNIEKNGFDMSRAEEVLGLK